MKFVDTKLTLDRDLVPAYSGYLQCRNEDMVLCADDVFVYDHTAGPSAIVHDHITDTRSPLGWVVDWLMGSTVRQVMESGDLPDKIFTVWTNVSNELAMGQPSIAIQIKPLGARAITMAVPLTEAIDAARYNAGIGDGFDALPPNIGAVQAAINAENHANMIAALQPPAGLRQIRQADAAQRAVNLQRVAQLQPIQFDPDDPFYLRPILPIKQKRKPIALTRNAYHSQPVPLP